MHVEAFDLSPVQGFIQGLLVWWGKLCDLLGAGRSRGRGGGGGYLA